MKTIEDQLVNHLSWTRFEDLPKDAIEAARKCIIDTLGITAAGTLGDDIDGLVRFLAAKRGPAEATVIGYRMQLSTADAAWANAAMARAFEFDDSHDPSGEHVSVPLLSAALATAESVGPVSGREFLRAYILAADLVPRLRLARKRNVGAFMSNTFAPFTAAAASALLMGQRDTDLYRALGWAYAQCAGAVQLQQGGGSALHVHHGMAAATGVQAAQLASAGLPGTEDFLTGKFGFYNAYDDGARDLDAIVDALGQRYEISRICTKQYPAGRVVHWPVEAAVQLRNEEKFNPEDIERVEVVYSRNGYRMTCEPEAERRTPTVGQHARFSLYFNVACALVRGRVDVADSTSEGLRDETVQTITRKIDIVFDPSEDAMIPPGDVTVVLRDGRRLRRKIGPLKGTPENPVTFDECADKYRRCVSFAQSRFNAANAEQVVDLVRDIENLPDVSVLARLLA